MSIAIDCGANLGSVTQELAKKYDTVWAFEPNKYAFRGLCHRCNNIKNVILINAAVVPRDHDESLVKIYYPHKKSTTSGTSIFKEKKNVSEDNFDYVLAVSFSDFVKDILLVHKFIDHIKMDIEGAEYGIVSDLIAQDLMSKIGTLEVEFHAKGHVFFREDHIRLIDILKEKKITNIKNHF